MIPFKLNGVTSFFKVKMSILDEYEDQNILKIELMVETPTWDQSSPEYSQQEQSIFDNRGWFVSPNTPAREQLFINSVTSYSDDAADVMNDDNYAQCWKVLSVSHDCKQHKLIQRRYQGLIIWFLPRILGISPKKAFNMICCTTQGVI